MNTATTALPVTVITPSALASTRTTAVAVQSSLPQKQQLPCCLTQQSSNNCSQTDTTTGGPAIPSQTTPSEMKGVVCPLSRHTYTFSLSWVYSSSSHTHTTCTAHIPSSCIASHSEMKLYMLTYIGFSRSGATEIDKDPFFPDQYLDNSAPEAITDRNGSVQMLK